MQPHKPLGGKEKAAKAGAEAPELAQGDQNGQRGQNEPGEQQGQNGSIERGTLYVCATPIGNLEDITLRVLRVLREVDLVAAEDTRHTRALLAHFGIQTPVTSLHRFNESKKSELVCRRLLQGEAIALVSDAGTPAISDPGNYLVQQAIEHNIPVVALPGPSAAITALIVSGLETRRFAFEGFLPRQGQARRRALRRLAQDERTLVFFEAPHRVVDTLADMKTVWGNRRCALVRELTKVFEEVLRGRLTEVEQALREQPRPGEMVLVVEGSTSSDQLAGDNASEPVAPAQEIDVVVAVQELMQEGKDKKTAIAEVVRRSGLRKRDVYEAVINLRSTPADNANKQAFRERP